MAAIVCYSSLGVGIGLEVVEIDWSRVRRVILNDRMVCYKPDRSVLNKIAGILPDCRFIGFMPYYEGWWSLAVESEYFPSDPFFTAQTPIHSIPITSLSNYKPPLKSST